MNPATYFKKAFPVLSFAFVSRSSAGALPLNIETQHKALGVDSASANLAASFGMSIGQNGCAGVYPAMLATICLLYTSTLAILALYRFGAYVPVPGIPFNEFANSFQDSGVSMTMLDLFTGGALSNFSVFSLGIMPYITASIIMQLMQVVILSLIHIS